MADDQAPVPIEAAPAEPAPPEPTFYVNSHVTRGDPLHVSHGEHGHSLRYGEWSNKPRKAGGMFDTRETVFVLHDGPGGKIDARIAKLYNPDTYRIIMFDQRACGNSTPSFTDESRKLREHALKNNTTGDLIEDIDRLRKRLNIREDEKIHLFGEGFGAALALAYTEKQPKRVESLLLHNVFLGRPEDIMHVRGALTEKAQRRDFTSIPHRDHLGPTNALRDHYFGKGCFLGDKNNTPAILPNLSKIPFKMPIRIVQAENDPFTSKAAAEKLAHELDAYGKDVKGIFTANADIDDPDTKRALGLMVMDIADREKSDKGKPPSRTVKSVVLKGLANAADSAIWFAQTPRINKR